MFSIDADINKAATLPGQFYNNPEHFEACREVGFCPFLANDRRRRRHCAGTPRRNALPVYGQFY